MVVDWMMNRRSVLLGSVALAAGLAARRASFAAGGGAEMVALTAIEAVAALKARDFTVREYVDALLERSERLAGLNVFITQDGAAVRARAEAIDRRRAAGEAVGTLEGLPFVVKDNTDTADLPTTGGTPALRDWRPAANAPVVQALLDAGGLVLGKTNMHELAFGITSNNAGFGAVGNPYDPTMIPGGSSGGTAAAVAARLAPAGLGSDTGGSCRIPAALCGCVGFRPTLGRYSQAGVIPLSHTRDTVGPLARSVEDVILLDRHAAAEPAEPVALTFGALRIGVPRAYFYEDLDPELAAVVEGALGQMRAAGMDLIEVDLANLKALNDAVSFPLVLYEAPRELSAYLYTHGSRMSVIDLVDQIAGPGEKGLMQSLMGEGAIPAAVYREALVTHRPALQAAYAAYFADNDLAAMVVPTTPLPARPIGQDETVELNGQQVPTFFTYIRNTDPPSNAGLPCLSVPAGLTASGLPVGIELVGPAMHDAEVLAIGRAFETTHPPLPAPDL